MLELSEEEVNELISSDKFIEDYNVYKKNIDVDKLRNFFDDIETNRNYFRLNIKKSKRFQNKNNDTLTIKNITSNINKCTESNVNEIIELIVTDINKNKHLINLVVESILEKCILHHTYINIYIKILEEINKHENIMRILNNTLNKYYKFIFEETILTTENVYDNLCNENKRNDNKIGYLMLMTYLDKNGIVKNKVDNLFKNIFENILEKENDEIFKLLNCIYNICLISTDYMKNYLEIIKLLKNKQYNSKVRCKVMDIEDIFKV